MQVLPVIDRSWWESFIQDHAVTTFMQSWAWGEFEESCGHKVSRHQIVEDGDPVAIVQTILIQSKRGRFLFVPHGPIISRQILPLSSWHNNEIANVSKVGDILEIIHAHLVRQAREARCHFIRLNSSLPHHPALADTLERLGYRQSPIYLTSENAAVVSLDTESPAQLTSKMRKTTRYLIHRAQKEGVTIEQDRSPEALSRFMKLYEVTTQREGFVGFDVSYIKREFEAFAQYDSAMILHARHKASILATALIIFTKNSAFYHQGASNHPKIPAPYLLQYSAMQLAQERGCKFYNLWGTYIPGRTPRSWHGLTLFKTGFTKTIWSYLPTYDLPLHPWYYATYAYEMYVRIKRGV